MSAKNIQNQTITEIAKVQPRGQVTIPIEIRRAMNIKPGDWIMFEKEKGRNLIKMFKVKKDRSIKQK